MEEWEFLHNTPTTWKNSLGHYCGKTTQVEEAAKGLLQVAMRQFSLSARDFHRILKVARTIADLAGGSPIGVAHVAEAIQYRPRGFQG